MDYLLRIFKAVANETRIRILEKLMDTKEQTLESLASSLKLPYKTVARNLKILEKALLASNRRWRGKVYYSLESSPHPIYGREILNMIKKRKLKRNKPA